MHFPTWVDLKGEDSVPETVHHVVSNCYDYRLVLHVRIIQTKQRKN